MDSLKRMGLADSSELGGFYCNTVSPERHMHSFRDIQIAAILAGFRAIVSRRTLFQHCGKWSTAHAATYIYRLRRALVLPRLAALIRLWCLNVSCLRLCRVLFLECSASFNLAIQGVATALCIAE